MTEYINSAAQSAGVPEAKVTGAWESARIGDFNAGWNACRDSVFTLMKKAAYMELDTTKRSIATQDELRALLAAAPAQPAAQDQGEVQRLRVALEWAVDRWHAEVASRPLVNVHRRALDDTWRQIIRRLGGDAGLLCGPAHDELLALAASTGQEVEP